MHNFEQIVVKLSTGSYINVVKSKDNLWVTQKTMARALETTTQNITIHLKEIFSLKNINQCCTIIPISQKEGSRAITRRTKHYDFETFHDVASRARKTDMITEILSKITSHNITPEQFRLTPIKERSFREILQTTLSGVEEFDYQVTLGDYRVDFFSPRLGLVIEFDEKHHNKTVNKRLDERRQKEIQEAFGYTFLRIAEGEELIGLNRILIMIKDSYTNVHPTYAS
jgi:very-short-patch-repair endonuclease